MTPFIDKFPDVAGREMLMLHVEQQGLSVPPGKYAFFEWYCEENGCDCRRVLFQVLSPEYPGKILATINYGWESAAFYTRWMHGDADAGREITSASLDPINPQSRLADALLDEFRDYIQTRPEFNQQLKRHYDLFSAPRQKKRPKRN